MKGLLVLHGVPESGLNRRVQACLSLSADKAERVLVVESLIGKVQVMLEEGVPGEAVGFDAARWLACWIRQPSPALSGRLPASYLHTLDGQRLVGKMLAMIASGT